MEAFRGSKESTGASGVRRVYHEHIPRAESEDVEARIREERKMKAFAKKHLASIPCRDPAKGPTLGETMHYYSERNRLMHDARLAPRPASHYERQNGDIIDRPRDELDVRSAPLGNGRVDSSGARMDEAQMHAEAALCAARKQRMPDPDVPPPVPGAAYDAVRAEDGADNMPRGRPPPAEDVRVYDPTKDYTRPGNHYPGAPGVPPDWRPPTVAPPNKAHACALCGFVGTRFRCGQCRDTFYCSRSCQRQHWPEHKELCSPAALFVDAEAEEAHVEAQLKRLGWGDDDDDDDDDDSETRSQGESDS